MKNIPSHVQYTFMRPPRHPTGRCTGSDPSDLNPGFRRWYARASSGVPHGSGTSGPIAISRPRRWMRSRKFQSKRPAANASHGEAGSSSIATGAASASARGSSLRAASSARASAVAKSSTISTRASPSVAPRHSSS